MRAFQLVSVIAIAALAFGQNPSDDPGGWTKAKWGMTEAELRATFPQIEQMREDGSDGIGLPRYVIENHLYSVWFLVAKETGLRTVHITFQKKLVKQDGTEVDLVECGAVHSCPSAVPQTTSSPSSKAQKKAAQKAAEDAAWAATKDAYIKAGLNEQAVRLAKDDLLTALSSKYGNPSDHSVKSAGIENYLWRFATTEITLMWTHSEYKQLDSVQLFYTARKKSSEL